MKLSKVLIKLFPKTIAKIQQDAIWENEIISQYGSMEGYIEYCNYQQQEILEQEYYNSCHEESEAEYVTRIAEEELNSLLKNKATRPLVAVGDKIHLLSKQGLYEVYFISPEGFKIKTKHNTHTKLYPWTDFKCIAGGLWNYRG